MEMNYFKKTGKMMVAACMLAGLPFIPGTVSASELQTQMMSVQMESTTLKELFDLIEEKFNYTFLIRNNDINLNERISIDMSNRSVEEILTTALKNQHADFVVNNNRIVVYKSSSNPNELRNTERMVAQQTITISGTIVDAVTGEPVIGANVLVKGTTNGTSTDFDGKFSLEAPAGATLVVSYIGYVNHEVKATSAPMTIRIKEDTQNLEEVVVVGYGVQKKESLTGAMQVVSNEKLLDATSPTVENLLSGKAPGVQVTSGGGQPGAAGKVVIRGKSTVNGSTDPLWIVTSDNGPVLDDGYQDQAVELVGDHKMAGPLRGGKTSLYDGGTCIPFMLRWPAEVKPGAVSDALVCQMDLLASLSALIGQTYSDKVDSQNTLPVFLGKGGNGRKELVLEGYFNYALRDGDWVMIPPYPDTYGDAEEAAFAGNSNCYQLYNVKEDIGQQVNLAEKEPKRLRQMMMTFERLKRETGKITNF